MTTFSAFSASDPPQAAAGLGTKDGIGGGDHDQPYTFGRRPRAVAPFPFNQRQYARLLALRGCVGDGLRGRGDVDGADVVSCPSLTFAGDADEVARAILETAGVLGGDPLREPQDPLREPGGSLREPQDPLREPQDLARS